MSRRFLALVCILTLFVLPVLAEKRVALVIGNGAYQANTRLKNPASDASDMAEALEEAGFVVSVLVDKGREAMEKAVRDFGNALKDPEAVGLFYYSGHGAQVEGNNYLLPVDADIQAEDELAYKAMNAEAVLAKMRSAGNRLNIVILDACRNNPFPGATKSAERGLAVVKVKVPESIIVYATDPGSVAQDGEGRNSPFTKAFIEQMGVPGQDIAVTLKRVTSAVKQATGGSQTPWVSTNYTVDFAFLPGAAATAAGGAQSPAPSMTLSPSAQPAVTMTLTAPKKTYGSLSVTAASAGVLYLDGVRLGDLPAGATANLDNIETGSRSLELRYAEGTPESRTVTVAEGRSTAVGFSWKKAVQAQSPYAAALASGNFLQVLGGSFTMGSPAGEKDRQKDEGPQHQVTVSAFAIGKCEVTVAEFRDFVNATGYKTDAERGGGGYVWTGSAWVKKADANWKNPYFPQGDSSPVVLVSWFDAVNYCNWRSGKEGLRPSYTISGTSVSCDFSAGGYRLPTEAEWEYAARGGQAGLGRTVKYAGSNNPDQVAWYSSNAGGGTHAVGLKTPNALGLYDMSGNVWEWCWDWYGEKYYASTASADPKGPPSGSYRVSRSGGWAGWAADLRVAYRCKDGPGDASGGLGFRLAVPPSP